MKPLYDYGEEVRLIRNIRNDGTYPGKATGELLMRRGTVGCVNDVGTFLQDQIIYKIHFLEEGKTIGCREEELIPASQPWIPNRFEFGDKVKTTKSLAVEGHVIFEKGAEGRIMKVLKSESIDVTVQYHVTFGDGRVFLIPENTLEALQVTESDETSLSAQVM